MRALVLSLPICIGHGAWAGQAVLTSAAGAAVGVISNAGCAISIQVSCLVAHLVREMFMLLGLQTCPWTSDLDQTAWAHGHEMTSSLRTLVLAVAGTHLVMTMPPTGLTPSTSYTRESARQMSHSEWTLWETFSRQASNAVMNACTHVL